MSRTPYNPRTFFRHVPPPLVRRFADHGRLPLDLDWDDPATDAAAVLAAWTDLSPTVRLPAEGVLRQTHDLATAAGARLLIDEGHAHGVDLATALAGVDGFHAQALAVFLDHPAVFRTAWQLHHADQLPARSWRRRNGLPEVEPDLSAKATTGFRAAVSDFLRREQGRGHRVTVDHFDRGDRGLWVFAYPDDYAQTYIGHDDRGHFRRHPLRPAFEVVYVYERSRRALELYAPGDRQVKDWFEDVFAEHFLHEDLTDRPVHPSFALDLLKSRDALAVMTPDPGGLVTDVRVRTVRLTLPSKAGRITLEAPAVGRPEDVFDMVDARLNHHTTRVADGTVSQAVFQFGYRRPGDEPGELPVTVTPPRFSGLKSAPDDLRDAVEALFRRWGVMRD